MALSTGYIRRRENPHGLTKSEAEHIAHFKLRLKERFDIHLTDKQYYEMLKKPQKFKCLYHLSVHTTLREGTINGKKVWVLYASKDHRRGVDLPARFKTALLPDTGFYIVPKDLSYIYDHEQFTAKLNETIAYMKKLSEKLDLNDKKSFFIKHVNEHRTIKYGALHYKLKGEASRLNLISTAVDYIKATAYKKVTFFTPIEKFFYDKYLRMKIFLKRIIRLKKIFK